MMKSSRSVISTGPHVAMRVDTIITSANEKKIRSTVVEIVICNVVVLKYVNHRSPLGRQTSPLPPENRKNRKAKNKPWNASSSTRHLIGQFVQVGIVCLRGGCVVCNK